MRIAIRSFTLALRHITLLVMLFALPQTLAAQNARPNDCTAVIQHPWPGDFIAEASSEGDCGVAEVTLKVFNWGDELKVWHASYFSNDLFGFENLATEQEMLYALHGWISFYASFSNTGSLPQWVEGADGPIASEFPFMVSDEFDRYDYMRATAMNGNMACYIQGFESLLCLVKDHNGPGLKPIGYQLFPG